MRSFEAAAIGGCILAEDTAAHRELFGTENRAARYFKTSREMVEQAQALVADAEARQRMSAELHRRVIMGRNTYADRLRAMLRVIDAGESSHTAVTYV
jgi:spore maturation protein CgeB